MDIDSSLLGENIKIIESIEPPSKLPFSPLSPELASSFPVTCSGLPASSISQEIASSTSTSDVVANGDDNTCERSNQLLSESRLALIPNSAAQIPPWTAISIKIILEYPSVLDGLATASRALPENETRSSTQNVAVGKRNCIQH